LLIGVCAPILLPSYPPDFSATGAYYAAQQGIAVQAKDVSSRQFLFSLLDLLEEMKKEIGPTDAIDNEAASCAYVENFALRVFSLADNEDRKGNATRYGFTIWRIDHAAIVD